MEKETQKESSHPGGPLSFDSALKEVIKGLRGHPLLLFMLGVGLLFATVAQPALLPFFILGMVIWGFLEVKKLRQGAVKSGGVKVAAGVKARDSEARTGGVAGEKHSTAAASGDISIGGKADLKGVKLKTGDVKIGSPVDDQGLRGKTEKDQ
jgi:hypothetical protein